INGQPSQSIRRSPPGLMLIAQRVAEREESPVIAIAGGLVNEDSEREKADVLIACVGLTFGFLAISQDFVSGFFFSAHRHSVSQQLGEGVNRLQRVQDTR